jgi:hypothetical protein
MTLSPDIDDLNANIYIYKYKLPASNGGVGVAVDVDVYVVECVALVSFSGPGLVLQRSCVPAA